MLKLVMCLILSHSQVVRVSNIVELARSVKMKVNFELPI